MLTKEEILKNLINDKQQFKNSHSLAKKIQIPLTHQWCNTKAEYVYCFLNNIEEEPLCSVCNKEPSVFPSFKKGYNHTCKNPNCIYQYKIKNKDNSKYKIKHSKEEFFKYIVKENKIELNKYFNNLEIPQEYKWCNNKSHYIYNIIHNITEKPICPICKEKHLNFKSFTYGYYDYCSVSCSMNDKNILNKIKETTISKYGVENISQLDIIKEKKKETTLKNYGVESPLQSKTIKEKVKQSVNKKYGVENISQLDIIKEKKKETTLKNYGVESPLKSEIIKEKVKQSVNKKYGVENVSKLDSIKEKKKETTLDNYDVENPFQSNEIKEKIYQNNIDKYGVKIPIQHPDIMKKVQNTNLKKYGHICSLYSVENKEKVKKIQFDKLKNKLINFNIELICDFEDYKGTYTEKYETNKIYYQEYKYKCIKCNYEFVDHMSDGRIPICRKCNPKSTNVSSYEKEIQEFLDEYNIKYKTNDRNIISPLELDLYFEDTKLAIEFNGLYYHSYQMLNSTRNVISQKQIELYKKHKLTPNVGMNFHLLKTKLCNEKDIKLFHVYENEWIEKKEVIKSMILNKLGLINNNLNARDCYIKEVSYQDSINFLDNNHIQGKTNSKIRLGLYLQKDKNGLKKDTLISLMTFSKNKNSINENIELDRFCNLINTNVRGSASKLFKYFIEKYTKRGDKIVSFADKRYSSGQLYHLLGFDYKYITKPNYKYTKNMNLYNRKMFQKQKIIEYKNIFDTNNIENIYYRLIKRYNENLTEYENMLLNGYDKIFDCGQIKFVYEIK